MFHDITDEEGLISLSRDAIRAPFSPSIGGRNYDLDHFGETSEYTNSGRIRPTDADYVVNSLSGLKSTFEKIRSGGGGGIVWLAADHIDAGDAENVDVPPNTTVASGRGLDGEPMCTIETSTKPRQLFRLADGVRFTSFEILGDELEYFDPADRVDTSTIDGAPIYAVGASRGVLVEGDDVEIDNMVIRGFTHAAILIDRPQTKVTGASYSTHIHHCELTDNPTESLGYGVSVRHGYPIIEYPFFDNNRHSVAGSGYHNCNYVLRYFLVGPTAHSHCIDVHGTSQSGKYGTDLTTLKRVSDPAHVEGARCAGGRFSIHHGVIMPMSVTGVKFRGVPAFGAQLHENLYFNASMPDEGTLGKTGDAYAAVSVGDVTPSEFGLSDKRQFFDCLTSNPMEQIGPPGGFGGGDADEKLKQQVDELQAAKKSLEREVAELKPKAEAADAVKAGFSKLMGN